MVFAGVGVGSEVATPLTESSCTVTVLASRTRSKGPWSVVTAKEMVSVWVAKTKSTVTATESTRGSLRTSDVTLLRMVEMSVGDRSELRSPVML